MSIHAITTKITRILWLSLLMFGTTACQTSTKKPDQTSQKLSTNTHQISLSPIEKTRLIAENNRLLAEELNQSLKNEVQKKTVLVEQLQNKTIKVTMLNSILFSSGQYKLNQQGDIAISKLVPVLKKHVQHGGIVRIVGHTDNLYVNKHNVDYKDNWDLSSLRAASVVRLLIWRHHMKPSSFRIEGHADTEPKASNATKRGRAKNRRIEFLLTSK